MGDDSGGVLAAFVDAGIASLPLAGYYLGHGGFEDAAVAYLAIIAFGAIRYTR